MTTEQLQMLFGCAFLLPEGQPGTEHCPASLNPLQLGFIKAVTLSIKVPAAGSGCDMYLVFTGEKHKVSAQVTSAFLSGGLSEIWYLFFKFIFI